MASRLGRDRVTEERSWFEERLEDELDRGFRLATVILGSAIEAEDAVADAALAAWRSRGRLRDPERFEAWFGRILVNRCRDRLRVGRRHPVAEMPRGEMESTASGAHVDFREGVSTRDALQRAFDVLEPDERVVLVLRFWHDLTVEGIADRVGIPAGTVKSRLHQATGRLRAALAAVEVNG